MNIYSTKLADPQWQRKRLEIFNRDNWACQSCGNTTKQLEIHHVDYFDGLRPWDYDNDSLLTLCHDCHQKEQARFKHEKYLLNSLKIFGFTANDMLQLSVLIETNPKFRDWFKGVIKKAIKES